jgi:hypothetical protein
VAPRTRKRPNFTYSISQFLIQTDSYAPKEICDAIYSGVPGASYDASIGGYWRVPCATEIDMALQIGFVIL